jgi:hypothetical protein
VDRGHRPVVAGVHGLQHVDHFLAARLADDDAVGTHPQRVLQTVALGDGALAFDVGRAAFHPAHMDLLKLKFRGVLDRQDAFLLSMKDDSALSVVVLPEPVPPETMTLSRVDTAACR